MEFKNCKNARRNTTMQLYWFSTIILQLLLLVTQTQLTQAADVIRVGGLFESSNSNLRVAFRRAVDAVNKDRDVMPNTQLAAKIANVHSNGSFRAARKVCSIIKSGVGAIFGPQSPKTSDQVESICEALEIPHIKTTMDLSSTWDGYSVNLYPHWSTLERAYSEVLKSLGWKKITIIYGNYYGLLRVQELMKDAHFDVTLKQLSSNYDYRSIFKDAREEGVRHLVLDVPRENLFTVLKQAQQVGMLTDYHNYFITSLDLHTIDFEEFSHGGARLFSLQLVDPQNPMVKQVLRDLRSQTNNKIKAIQTEVALMYDAVQVFVQAVDDLSRSQSLDITPLDCDGDATWANGGALINSMREVEINGLTGLIRFDGVDGVRSGVSFAVVKLTKDGLKNIGSWDLIRGTNLTRAAGNIEDVMEESLQDKPLTVSIALHEPYIMLSENSEQKSGNDRYEGFCIDLLEAVSGRLGFNFTLVQTTDNSYGHIDQYTNEWTGLIGDLINLRADLAITDLTITWQREEVVDFTIPWMNTGIGILYVKPRRIAPSTFIFMYPFTIELWIYVGLTYLGVSLIIFALARLSPSEQVSELSTLEDNHKKMGNSFSWDNSLWFTIGSLLQQRTYQQPRAASTRIVAFMWWFFVLVMICSYTASLVTIFMAGIGGRLDEPIVDVMDLAYQDEIKYGTVKPGTTLNFFKNSKIYTYKNIYNQMENVNSYEEGIERVQQSQGGYAFFLESTSIDYETERRCNLQQVGGLLDSKSYGIALPPGSPYRERMNTAIMRLKEDGLLHTLKKKWWYEMRGGGLCKTGPSSKGPRPVELGPHNVSGVFIILLIGVAIAILVATAEFLWDYRKRKNMELQKTENQE